MLDDLPRVAVAGCTGTISRLCVAATLDSPSCRFSGAITHRLHSRQLYASVALRAALWAIGKPPGLYGMMDLLQNS